MPAPPLILASTSAYRRELLGRLGIDFTCVAPGVEEGVRPGESPPARARRLALEKARAVAARHPGALVLGSDQVAAIGATILDKPGDASRARAQLTRLSGSVAEFHTAVALVTHAGRESSHVDLTRTVARQLDAAEIARYVERERPLDCAGGFKVEALGIALFERIESQDPTALVGLPLIWVAAALRHEGVPIP